jgi:hypothetical protein
VIDRVAFDMAGHCVEVRRSLGDALAFGYSVDLQ